MASCLAVKDSAGTIGVQGSDDFKVRRFRKCRFCASVRQTRSDFSGGGPEPRRRARGSAPCSPLDEVEFAVIPDEAGVSDPVLSKQVSYLEDASYAV